jgi:hypothetical protein
LICSIILFALAPGYFPEPDHRCFERLARAAADPSNAFASVVPEQARAALASILSGCRPECMPHRLVCSWWDLNASTTFFRHPETARVVRHARLAAGEDDDEGAHAARRRWRR